MSDNAADNTESTPKAEIINKSEFKSLYRHVRPYLKDTCTSDASLAMHLMKESKHLKQNGFDNTADIFSLIASTLDPSPLVKTDIARR